MNAVRLLPVFVSFLLIAAHFQRAGMSLVALFCLIAPGVLLFTNAWSVRVVQVLLIGAAVEWVRTLVHLVQIRQDAGMPWARLAIILGIVIVFTAGSIFIFRHRKIRQKYNLG